MEKKIYFFIVVYPEWNVGSHKYESIVFDYFCKKSKNVFVYGNKGIRRKYMFNIFVRIFFGIYHAIRIPRKSIIIMNNSFRIDYFLPLIVNKFWKRHVYFLIIHDLTQAQNSSFIRRFIENYFIKKTSGITVSESMKKELIELNLKSSNIEVVSPGLDVNFEKIPEMKIFPKIPKLLYVGSIEPRKGIFYLIDSLKYLSDKEYELNLVGGNLELNYVDKVKEMILSSGIQDKVHFRGKVLQSELEKYYLDSTIFVFPSLYEGYGMVLAEAMAYGLPIVATNIPTTLELVENGVEGVLVEPGNSDDLGIVLKKLLHDKTLLEKFSNNALKKSEIFPTWEQTSENIWNIICQID